MGWLPRPARLGLARAIGRAARRLFPAERAVVRATLEVMTAASGARLDELTAGVFRDFAMCFSDLVTTNRQPSARLTAHVGQARGAERARAARGRHDLADRPRRQLGARRPAARARSPRGRPTSWWPRRKYGRSSDGCGGMAMAFASFPAPRRPSRSSWSPRSGEGRSWRCRATARWEPAGMPWSRSSGARRRFRWAVPPCPRAAGAPRSRLLHARLRPPLRGDLRSRSPSRAGGEEDALRAWVALLEDIVRGTRPSGSTSSTSGTPSPGNAKSLDVESAKVLDASRPSW